MKLHSLTAPRRAVSLAALCLCGFLHAEASSISSVAFGGDAAKPTITVFGSGFEPEPAVSNNAWPGYTGQDFGTDLHIRVPGGPLLWDAGYDNPGLGAHDIIGLLILSYSDTSISYQLGSYYNEAYVPNGIELSQGDNFTVYVKDASMSGTVDYNAPEPWSAGLVGAGLLVSGLRRRFRA
jgi:hypothetical protein